MSARRRIATSLALIVVTTAGAWYVQRERRVFDLTDEQTLTLTAETLDVLERLDGDVEMKAFFRADDPARGQAVALLSRYRRQDRRITFDLVDPRDAPGETQRLGVDPALGGVAIRRGSAVEVATTPTEQDITSALVRLMRGRTANICHAMGHGEPPLASDASPGVSAAARLLREHGYRLAEIDLLVEAEVPSHCDAVMMVNPTAPLGDAGQLLADWLRAGGRLLLLTDPLSDVDVSTVLRPYGLSIRRGIVVENDPESALPDDPVSPIVRTYSTAHPVARRLPPTYFPGAQEVVVDDAASGNGGLTLSHVADTSPSSYLDRDPLILEFDEGRDVRGPLTLVAAADRSRLEGSTVQRTRLVVTGDADFATNAFLGEAGNARLLVHAIDWLTLDEELVVLSTHLARDRPLTLTQARARYAVFVTTVVVPGLFVLAGALVWALRRGR